MGTIQYLLKNGERVQGITTLKSQQLGWGKQPLLFWANKQGLAGKTLNEARNTATIPGTIVHLMIECFLKNGEISVEAGFNATEYNPDDIKKAQTAFDNFMKWWVDNKVTPVAIEPHLVSEIWGFGSTPDLIANTNNGLTITDWKSGKIYEDIFLQLMGNKITWEENNSDMPIKGFHVLRISKDEDIPSFQHSFWGKMPDEAEEAIKACLILKRCQDRLKQLL